jgi:hypothetical protein
VYMPNRPDSPTSDTVFTCDINTKLPFTQDLRYPKSNLPF